MTTRAPIGCMSYFLWVFTYCCSPATTLRLCDRRSRLLDGPARPATGCGRIVGHAVTAGGGTESDAAAILHRTGPAGGRVPWIRSAGHRRAGPQTAGHGAVRPAAGLDATPADRAADRAGGPPPPPDARQPARRRAGPGAGGAECRRG